MLNKGQIITPIVTKNVLKTVDLNKCICLKQIWYYDAANDK